MHGTDCISGPQSAGSASGPACYGRGGREPTITDANLLLGRLSAARFLGGDVPLDIEAARRAVRHIAQPPSYRGDSGLVEIADGILSIATVIMAGAIKQVSVEHGLDPRDFALFCYGGAGPLHASALARELSIPTIIIPPEPGNFSAIGMLLADARLDLAKTFVGPLNESTVAALNAAFAETQAEARAVLVREFGESAMVFERHAEMRYTGQRHNIKVAIANSGTAADIRLAFDRDYRRRYGHADGKAQAEIQALHLSAVIGLRRPELGHLPRRDAPGRSPGLRSVYVGGHGLVDAAVYQRVGFTARICRHRSGHHRGIRLDDASVAGDRFTIGDLHEIQVHGAKTGGAL